MDNQDLALTLPDPAPARPVPIVAIGASAGGIEAITELLQHLSPSTGLAYVYVQHLDPTANSHLTSILSRATAMTVLEAGHRMPIQPNHLYVIPSSQDLEVIDGMLWLVPRQTQGASHLPIDRFFVSLVERQQDASIGVILSGMATDGTLGLRAIRAAGGVTIAQDATARFQSMPRAAIADDVVDKVLPPAGIARELELLSRKASLFHQTAVALEPELTDDGQGDIDEDSDSEEAINNIIRLLRRAIDVDFSHYKMTTIRRRITRRMLLFKFETLTEYATYLKQNSGEMRQLYNDLLINVTTFFRDTETMDYLSRVLLPRLLKTTPARNSVRIWIPACSTGQEAYSLAIMLLEILGDKASSLTIQIFATDLSEAAVARARLGSYTLSEVMDVSPRRLQRFFTKVDDLYRINRTIRDICVFAPQNILRDPPFSRLDLISCRNLLIYFDPIIQRKTIATFHYALNPNGYLVLGKSETVGSMATHFAQLEKSVKVFTRKNDATTRPSFELAFRAGADRPGPDIDGEPIGAGNPLLLPANRQKPIPVNNMERVVDELLLRQYVPASVVVNEELDILQFRGSTSLFLEPAPGKASLNLLKMARPSLVFELRSTVAKARKAAQPVRKTGLEVKTGGTSHQVTIEVVPLKADTDEQLYLILFTETIPVVLSGGDPTEIPNRRIKQLEDELATLREDMRSIIEEQETSTEELQSANEEIISSNEELQSINEELETGKEEIESTNEELLTINQELQVRNDQLSEANEFSDVIFATIREATLVLDGDLRVISANKTFYRLFRVQEGETEGRLIYELGDRQWDIPQLRTLLTDVIQQNAQVDSYEVSHTFSVIGEKVLMLNARRVVRQREAILLAIEDITEHRRAQHLIAEREAFLHDLVDKAPVLIWVAGGDGRYTFFNSAWLEYTGDSLSNALEHGWEHAIHPDDRESYLVVYNTAFGQRQPFQMEFRLRREDGDYRWMLVNAKPSFAGEGTFTGYIGTCAEIYNRKTLLQALDVRAQQRMQAILEVNASVLRTRHEQEQTDPDAPEAGLLRQQLHQHQEQFQDLTHNTPDAISRWDADLRLTYANPAFLRKMNLPNLADSLGKTNLELGQTEEISRPFMNKLRQVFATRTTQNHYNPYPTSEGIAYFYSTIVPELGADGAVQRVLVVTRDVSDLKLVEEIQQTATSLQVVLDNSPAAIALFRSVRNVQLEVVDFQLLVCNQRFSDIMRQPIEALTGQSVLQLADRLWQADTYSELLAVVTSGQSRYLEQENALSGTWTGLSISRQGDGVVLTGLDITALKQAEAQRLQQLEELEKSQENVNALEEIRRHVRERGEFLRTTTHDLRGSFGVVRGAAALMDLMDSDEERGQMLSMMQRNLHQTTQLLTDLLDYARLEAGQEHVQLTTFDAAEALCNLTESMRPLANERGLSLTYLGPDALRVESDATKVQRIAQNLLLNALKYTPAGEITVSWGPDAVAGRWQFSVQDTGPGLSPELVELFTDPPEADGAPAPAATGSGEGVGLFIIRQLCRLLEATLTVDSTAGVGTTFRVSLPGYP